MKTWKNDYLALVSAAMIVAGIVIHVLALADPTGAVGIFSAGTAEFVQLIWWGVLLGILFISVMGQVPRESVISLLGSKRGPAGILRASCAGLFFDLCSHGILMVGVKLYERGATLGQTLAFLISSPWNSFSLTLVLFGLIGVPWTLTFIVLSLLIAFVSGMVFDWLEASGFVSSNPHRVTTGIKQRPIGQVLHDIWQNLDWSPGALKQMVRDGISESRMVIRWVLLGVVVAAVVRVLLTPEALTQYFGPSLFGQFATLVGATVIEVCSEGSMPLASDIFNIAKAPGNAFLFLMAGASTDYTEIMILKEYTKSWKIALLLPVVTVPQIFLLSALLNAL